LQQAIDSAMKNNIQVKLATVEEHKNDLDLLNAVYSQYPNLNLSAGVNLDFGRNLDPFQYIYVNNTTISNSDNLTSSIVLFQGFEKSNQIKKSRLNVESAKQGTQKMKNDLILQVIANYLSLINLKKQLVAAKDQHALAEQTLNFEVKNVSAGKKMLADLSRARSQVSKSDVDIITIKNQYNNTMVTLKQLMNLNPSTDIELVEPLETDSLTEKKNLSEVYNYALNNLPEIKQAEINTLAAKKSIEIAKGNYFPSLILTGATATGYSHQFNYINNILYGIPSPLFTQFKSNLYEYVGLTLNIPIFNGFHAKMAVKESKIEFEKAGLAEQQAKNDLYKSVSTAMDDLDAAEKKYISSQQAYESNKATYHVIERRYKSGLSNSLDFNQALIDMNQAQFTLIYDRYNLIFKKKVIAFYLGNPIFY
jgi:outer membrane protein